MKTLKTIYDTDVGYNNPEPETYKLRSAARAVVFDADKKVALLHATKKSYHKLPGGGIEEGEDMETALKRELLEEIGCKANNLQELGIIEEYRNGFQEHQTSYCFIASLVGKKGTNDLEDDEIAHGFEPVWMDLKTAIQTLEGEINNENYEARFMVLRDLTFLKEAEIQLK